MVFSSNFTKALVERGLQAEMAEHLGHNKQAPVTNSVLAMLGTVKPQDAEG